MFKALLPHTGTCAHTHTRTHTSPPLVPLAACSALNAQKTCIHAWLPGKTTLCVLLSVNTIKALLLHETLIYTRVLRDKSLVSTIQVGYETARLLFPLIVHADRTRSHRCYQSHQFERCFPWTGLHGQQSHRIERTTDPRGCSSQCSLCLSETVPWKRSRSTNYKGKIQHQWSSWIWIWYQYVYLQYTLHLSLLTGAVPSHYNNYTHF